MSKRKAVNSQELHLPRDDMTEEQTGTLTEAVSPHERLLLLDVLRGFALIGVLLVNARDYAWVPEPTGFHIAVRTCIDIIASGKFATLFQLLFGIGFAIQLSRWSSASGGFTIRYIRRSAALWLIGWAAIVATGGGSTLQQYAVASLGLVFMRGFSVRTLLLTFAGLFVISSTGLSAAAYDQVSRWREAGDSANTEALADKANDEARLRELGRAIRTTRESGSYIDHMQAWWRVTTERFPAPVLVPERVGLGSLAIFTLGLFLWRSGIVADPRRHTTAFAAAVRIGLPVGLAGQVVVRLTEETRENWEPSAIVDGLIALGDDTTVVMLSLGYGAAVALLVLGPFGHRLTSLAYQGRMGLTVFLLQWLSLRLIFGGTGFGLGFSGKLAYGWSVPITIVLTVSCILLARWWFGRFSVGPMEAVWRVMTYGRMRRSRVHREVGAPV